MATRISSSSPSSSMSISSSSSSISSSCHRVGRYQQAKAKAKAVVINTNSHSRFSILERKKKKYVSTTAVSKTLQHQRRTVLVSAILESRSNDNHTNASKHIQIIPSTCITHQQHRQHFRQQRLTVISHSSSSSSSSSSVDEVQEESSGSNTLLLGVLFSLWYAANIVFNIYNKQVLKVFAFPVSCTELQFFIGSVIAITMWTLKLHPKPKVDKQLLKSIAPLAVVHMLGNLLTNVSLGKVAVSFTHTIKVSTTTTTTSTIHLYNYNNMNIVLVVKFECLVAE